MGQAVPRIHRVKVTGAHLHYELRGSGPLLLLLGAPMDATGFEALSSALAGAFTVVTSDPRGIGRSTCDDPKQDANPDVLADDAYQLLSIVGTDVGTDVGTEPAYVFGSSGGAVVALALAARHPEKVRALIAHEPPLVELLPNAAQLRAQIDDLCEAYRREGPGAAWQRFFALTGLGARPDRSTDEWLEEAPPPPSRNDDEYFFAHMLRPLTRYVPDVTRLRNVSHPIIVGGGSDSSGQLPRRTAEALAAALDQPLVDFPGGHAGFAEHPQACADGLRRTLASRT